MKQQFFIQKNTQCPDIQFVFVINNPLDLEFRILDSEFRLLFSMLSGHSNVLWKLRLILPISQIGKSLGPETGNVIFLIGSIAGHDTLRLRLNIEILSLYHDLYGNLEARPVHYKAEETVCRVTGPSELWFLQHRTGPCGICTSPHPWGWFLCGN